jgi:hypothetical protein
MVLLEAWITRNPATFCLFTLALMGSVLFIYYMIAWFLIR